MNFRPKSRNSPEINLIPMIDVLIVLLIFLVLTTTFSRESALQIRLPEAQSKQLPEEKGLEIAVDAEGRYYVNQQQVANTRIETLKEVIQAAAGGNREPLIIISADQKALHQSVVTVLDAVSQLGFAHVTFATREAESGS
jgi:biopolymer transport protein ExbD